MPTLLGVPVRIRSPGSSVIVSREEGDDLGDAEDQVAVRESWRSSPLIHVRSARSPGSATSSAVVIDGPKGHEPSKPLPASTGAWRAAGRVRVRSSATAKPATSPPGP